MENKTIIYIGGFELPDKNAAAHRVLGNGKVLRELGYNVVYIGIDKSLKYSVNIQMPKRTIQGFECWVLPYPTTKIEWIKYLTIIDSVKKIIGQYSNTKAVIAYNYQAIPLLKLRNYCRKNDFKIVADCTEWYSTKGSNICFKIIKGLDSFFRMRIIQKKLDGLIVISKYLKNYYNCCKNVIRIPPLVDLSEEKWNIDTDNALDNKLKFIYLGSPGRNKDKLDIFIDMLSELTELNNYIFNIIGITKDQFIHDYPQKIKNINILGEHVKFWGQMSHKESLTILKNSDFSVFIRERSRQSNAGFPTKFVESISCGVPVITTKTSDLENFLFEEQNGFFVDTVMKNRRNNNLIKILNYKKEMIELMKRDCYTSRMFNYKNYSSEFDNFIRSVLNED